MLTWRRGIKANGRLLVAKLRNDERAVGAGGTGVSFGHVSTLLAIALGLFAWAGRAESTTFSILPSAAPIERGETPRGAVAGRAMAVKAAATAARIEGHPDGTTLVVKPAPSAGSLATADFWRGPNAGEARRLAASAGPGSVINVTDRTIDENRPWRLVPSPGCGPNQDCIPPANPIVHLVAPKADWPITNITVRSAGEYVVDPGAPDGGGRKAVITAGPGDSVVEAYFKKKDGPAGVVIEFDVASPNNFETIVVRNIERALDHIEEQWGR